MASKRRVRRKAQRRGCLDKEPFPSEKIATEQVYRLLRRSNKDPMRAKVGFLKAYRCDFCSAWHIGNVKDKDSMGRFIGLLKRKGVIA